MFTYSETNNSNNSSIHQNNAILTENILKDAKQKITPKVFTKKNQQQSESAQKSPGLPTFDKLETKALLMDKIIADVTIQQRMKISESTVRDYVKVLNEGRQFPPIVIFMDQVGDEEPKYYLADGFHRFFAYQKTKLSEIQCEIYKGTKLQAMFYAAGCNGTHGLKRSNKDKKKAVNTVLVDSNWNRLTDNEIARHCQVSQPFVSKLRSKIKKDPSCETKRIDKNGREIDTQKIGRSKTTTENILIDKSFMQEVKPEQFDPIGISVLKQIQNFYTKISEKPKDRVFLLSAIQEHLEACRRLLPQEELVEV